MFSGGGGFPPCSSLDQRTCNFHKNALRRHWYDLSDAEAHKCLLYVCNGCLNHVMPSWLLNTCMLKYVKLREI